MRKEAIFLLACISISIFCSTRVMAKILDNDDINHKASVSVTISRDKAVSLAREYMSADAELREMCVLDKYKVLESRLSEGYWEVQFPLKRRFGIGFFRRWAILYVDTNTGEIKEGGQTPDL